ncbi:amidase [Corallococcus coralloides DSM 2259]|uniref:Amidase n=1 Tax=Corallococcus coralloides (strain ATCC 25202 / DSM 2259 / NBRC 100086 / M2) TaxID=1144275 RepID=H8MX51_CORCM|nr:amidase [Corallococcus coralloides]AFE08880.1 amidase [Corallococcus coralloides DSM 2259]
MTKKTAASDVTPGFSRRTLLGAAAAVTGALAARNAHAQAPSAAAPGATTAGAFALEEVTVAELRAGLESGKHTARGLTEAYLARIRALDRTGDLPLCSVIELNPDALAQADALDAERKAKGARGPLHGIPVLIKDNIATADKMQTTAGSLALVGAVPPRDAFIVERLRAAGAVLLGKTNLSEWANFRSTHSTSGWSGRGGLCRNPYALDRTPSGSSSGSGAATAANFCAVSVGTETDGSIVSPASACSLVGLKPTVGLVSRAGIIPISSTQDTAGPMTRTVADAAALLGVLAGEDPRDAATAASRGHAHADYTKFLDPQGLKGARIGVPRERFFGYHPATDAIAERALEVMKAQGAVLVDLVALPNVAKLDEPELEVMLYEFKAGLEAYLAQLGEGAPVRTFADLIAFNEKHREREMPYFGQELLLQAQKKGPLTDAAYKKALAACRRYSRAEGVDAVMNKHKLDALVAPTQAPAGPIDLVLGDHWLGSSSTPAAVSGYPSITVPAGDVHGLPVGVSFIGRAWSEPVLLKLAYAYEQASHARRKPGFARSLDPRGG